MQDFLHPLWLFSFTLRILKWLHSDRSQRRSFDNGARSDSVAPRELNNPYLMPFMMYPQSDSRYVFCSLGVSGSLCGRGVGCGHELRKPRRSPSSTFGSILGAPDCGFAHRGGGHHLEYLGGPIEAREALNWPERNRMGELGCF